MGTTSPQERWHISTVAETRLDCGALLPPRHASAWVLLRSGRIALGAGAGRIVLAPGDAVHLPHAALSPLRALEPSVVLQADLRREAEQEDARPLIARGFAEHQRGVVGLLELCPVTASMTIDQPAVAAAHAALLGAAMQAEHRAEDIGAPLADPALERVVSAVLADPSRRWRLDELAALAHLGSTALTERFRRSIGLSPMRWLRSARLRQAGRELETTQAPLSTIACRAGYGSAAAFVRAFQAETGSTPGRWRDQARGRILMRENPSTATAAAAAPSAIAAR